MQKSDSITKLAGALVKAQAEVENVKKDSVNPHFRSNYSSLAAVCDAVLPVLNKHGLAVTQLSIPDNEMCILETMLIHESGEWLSGQMSVPLAKRDPQGLGSALTYARRYSLLALLNVASEDDDANAASTPPRNQQNQQPRQNAAQLHKQTGTTQPTRREMMVTKINNLTAKLKAAGESAQPPAPLSEMSEDQLEIYGLQLKDWLEGLPKQ